MKTTLFAVLSLAVSGAALAQTPPAAAPAKHKVVFQMNVADNDSWNQLFGNIGNAQKAFQKDGIQIEVVFYGKGVTRAAENQHRIRGPPAEGRCGGRRSRRVPEFHASQEDHQPGYFSFFHGSRLRRGGADPQAGGWIFLHPGRRMRLHRRSMDVGPARFLFASQLRDSRIDLRSERKQIFSFHLIEAHGVLARRQGDAALGKFL